MRTIKTGNVRDSCLIFIQTKYINKTNISIQRVCRLNNYTVILTNTFLRTRLQNVLYSN